MTGHTPKEFQGFIIEEIRTTQILIKNIAQMKEMTDKAYHASYDEKISDLEKKLDYLNKLMTVPTWMYEV